MKKLKEGYTTGSCLTAAALASALWQVSGCFPEMVSIETPSGKTLELPVCGYDDYVCGVRKFSGDDPDVTDGCIVKAQVIPGSEDGEIVFTAGEGVGTVTRRGLKIPPGEPAVNPVPRDMVRSALRDIIGDRSAEVVVSVPGGEEIAAKTFNPRLGIEGGISILGTTGIVRPMSEDAVKESLAAELSVCRAEYGTAAAFVTGYSGEEYLKNTYPGADSVVLCSNWLGFLLDEALETGFTDIVIAGGAGKLLKPAADIMNLHSHTAGGQREVLCTHAALCGASAETVRKIYQCSVTKQMCGVLRDAGILDEVMQSAADAAAEKCRLRTRGKINIAYIVLDDENRVLAVSGGSEQTIKRWSEKVCMSL